MVQSIELSDFPLIMGFLNGTPDSSYPAGRVKIMGAAPGTVEAVQVVRAIQGLPGIE